MNAETDSAITAYANPWTTWLNYFQVLHRCQQQWCHVWGHYCMPSFFGPHPHERHHQLEIPDPLAESKEPELFA